MSFSTIHTNYGLQALARAESTGTQIRLTHMAVGDENGNAVTPDPAQTTLVRERFRTTINRVFQDASNPLRFTAELVIPASEGGFTLREVGAFDAEGLDATDYAILCHDKWESSDAVVEDDGTVIQPAVEAGYRYTVRYDELFGFILASL